MAWLFLVLAIACFAVAFKTSSIGLAALCLLGALGFLLAWVFGLLSARIASRARDESLILGVDDLRRLREQAQARRVAGEPDLATCGIAAGDEARTAGGGEPGGAD